MGVWMANPAQLQLKDDSWQSQITRLFPKPKYYTKTFFSILRNHIHRKQVLIKVVLQVLVCQASILISKMFASVFLMIWSERELKGELKRAIFGQLYVVSLGDYGLQIESSMIQNQTPMKLDENYMTIQNPTSKLYHIDLFSIKFDQIVIKIDLILIYRLKKIWFKHKKVN